jgi:OFA family oxalate/formate antiporter-like MFS transporter
MFSFGTFAGLLIIGQLAKIGLEQASMATPYYLVAYMQYLTSPGALVVGLYPIN